VDVLDFLVKETMVDSSVSEQHETPCSSSLLAMREYWSYSLQHLGMVFSSISALESVIKGWVRVTCGIKPTPQDTQYDSDVGAGDDVGASDDVGARLGS